MPQDLALFDELTALANLQLFAALYDIDGSAAKRAIAEALDLVGLADRAHDRVKDYSGGTKRRLNLASTLLHDPQILLLDEPAVALALMTAGFGLLVATFGKTPEATRGLSIFATLIVVMLGGAWIPMFLFPQWLQNFSLAVPPRWAMDGLEAMTWRGLGLEAALAPIGVLLLFAVIFGGLAVARFHWEAES